MCVSMYFYLLFGSEWTCERCFFFRFCCICFSGNWYVYTKEYLKLHIIYIVSKYLCLSETAVRGLLIAHLFVCLFTRTPFSSAALPSLSLFSANAFGPANGRSVVVVLVFRAPLGPLFRSRSLFCSGQSRFTTILLIFLPLSRMLRSLSLRPPPLSPTSRQVEVENFHRHFCCLFRVFITYDYYPSLALCFPCEFSLFWAIIALDLHLVLRLKKWNNFSPAFRLYSLFRSTFECCEAPLGDQLFAICNHRRQCWLGKPARAAFGWVIGGLVYEFKNQRNW